MSIRSSLRRALQRCVYDFSRQNLAESCISELRFRILTTPPDLMYKLLIRRRDHRSYRMVERYMLYYASRDLVSGHSQLGMALPASDSVEDGSERHPRPRPALHHAQKSETSSETGAHPTADDDSAALMFLDTLTMCFLNNITKSAKPQKCFFVQYSTGLSDCGWPLMRFGSISSSSTSCGRSLRCMDFDDKRRIYDREPVLDDEI